jgi:hypothetical protein
MANGIFHYEIYIEKGGVWKQTIWIPSASNAGVHVHGAIDKLLTP